MQSNNSFRKPIGSPFRRPLIPTERKSPTNEVNIKKPLIEKAQFAKLHCNGRTLRKTDIIGALFAVRIQYENTETQ